MTQFTQKALLDTFTGMLQRMPFEKITVSALVAGCGVSPDTFYYHFHDIYDLLEHWLLRIKERYVLEPLRAGADWREMLRALLRTMRQNQAVVYHLFNSTSREWIERYCFEASGDTFYELIRQAVGDALPEEEMRALAQYTGCAFLGLMLRFLWRQMEVDLDASVERFGVIFESNLRQAIRAAQGAGDGPGGPGRSAP